MDTIEIPDDAGVVAVAWVEAAEVPSASMALTT
jgi:hypothetical protein